jgi:hypothetical protein
MIELEAGRISKMQGLKERPKSSRIEAEFTYVFCGRLKRYALKAIYEMASN